MKSTLVVLGLLALNLMNSTAHACSVAASKGTCTFIDNSDISGSGDPVTKTEAYDDAGCTAPSFCPSGESQYCQEGSCGNSGYQASSCGCR